MIGTYRGKNRGLSLACTTGAFGGAKVGLGVRARSARHPKARAVQATYVWGGLLSWSVHEFV